MNSSSTSSYNREYLNNEYAALLEKEKEIELQLDAEINKIKNLKRNLLDLPKIHENFCSLDSDTKQLYTVLDNSTKLSEKINLQIQQLDTARLRVSECQKRVQDLLDLQLCSEGVQNALKNENYEQAAVHVHRFLAMDQQLLKQTADDMAQDCAAISQSMKLLRNAAAMLQNKISLHFKEAISVNDIESVKRFFKLFPLIDMQEYGLENFAVFLRKMIKNTVSEKLSEVKNSNTKDKKHNMIFADAITFLFEEMAQLIVEHQPLVETYYGLDGLVDIMNALQKECDLLSDKIVTEFKTQRDMNVKLRIINEISRSSSSKTEYIDPKDIDMLLNEITLIHARYGLYLNFIHSLITKHIGPENEKFDKIIDELKNLNSSNNITKQMQVLIGDYLLLERYYMEQSIKKAITMDTCDTDALVSTMVDDIFFIVKKCIRRAYSSGNVDAVCAIINNTCTILETDVCNTLRQQLRQGYSVGYLDLTQAYNVMIQGRLQQMDTEQSKLLFLAYLNNCDVCSEYTNMLLTTLTDELQCSTKHEKEKLESCLSGLTSVSSTFTTVKDYGLQQIKSSVVKPRVVPWVDNFLSVSHQLSFEEFSSYEANEPFIRSLIMNLESLLREFKPRLTLSNYDSFILIIADELMTQLEKDILKTDFNRRSEILARSTLNVDSSTGYSQKSSDEQFLMGGLVLDKEIRTLVTYLSNATSWSIRDKFSRLTQIAVVLNLEKVIEIQEYWGTENCSFTWRLTPKEIKQFLLLRKDFRAEDVKRLKLM